MSVGVVFKEYIGTYNFCHLDCHFYCILEQAWQAQQFWCVNWGWGNYGGWPPNKLTVCDFWCNISCVGNKMFLCYKGLLLCNLVSLCILPWTEALHLQWIAVSLPRTHGTPYHGQRYRGGIPVQGSPNFWFTRLRSHAKILHESALWGFPQRVAGVVWTFTFIHVPDISIIRLHALARLKVVA